MGSIPEKSSLPVYNGWLSWEEPGAFSTPSLAALKPPGQFPDQRCPIPEGNPNEEIARSGHAGCRRCARRLWQEGGAGSRSGPGSRRCPGPRARPGCRSGRCRSRFRCRRFCFGCRHLRFRRCVRRLQVSDSRLTKKPPSGGFFVLCRGRSLRSRTRQRWGHSLRSRTQPTCDTATADPAAAAPAPAAPRFAPAAASPRHGRSRHCAASAPAPAPPAASD